MGTTAVRRASRAGLGAALFAGLVSAALAQQPAAMGAEKMREMLVQPAGWTLNYSHFSNRGDVGSYDAIFEVRGDKVVARFKDIVHARSCERDVTISADEVRFDGCYATDITLRFDPNDPQFPLKGTSSKMSYDYKLQRK